MNTLTQTQVRLFASAQSWIEGEAVRQLYATAKLDGVCRAVGFPDLHPGKGTPVGAAFVTEFVMTAVFLFVIMGATHGKAPAGFAPLAIGLALTLIHLVSIPVTNTSVNPARSTGPALFVGDWALSQLWLFWLAPILGGIVGAVIYRWLSDEPSANVTGNAPPH